MRYFYHYGKHITYSSRVGLTPDNFATSNALIEITEEQYNHMLEDEERIVAAHPEIEGWHFPIACEEIPEGKFLYHQIIFSWVKPR